MKKVLISFLAMTILIAVHAQVTVKVGSALLQNPGTDVHLPVSVTGLTGAAGVTGIELHISYTNTALLYDTTLNFNSLTPGAQWYYGGNGIEYSTNWLEPAGHKLNIPDNTVLFDIVFHYLGSSTNLIFDTTRCLLFDSTFNIIAGVHYIDGKVTPSQGSGESRWNGTGAWNTNANWSNGIPGDSTNAIIESGEVTVLSSASCKSIAINQGTTLNLSPNFSLTVNRDYTNNGNLNLLSDATGTGSLIVRGSVSGTGVNKFQRYLEFASGNPHFVSSPVNSEKTSIFGSNVVEKYSENSASWTVMQSSDNLETGVGYRLSGSTPATFTFQGTFNSGDITRNNLPYNGSGQAESRGLNLLGNPYPSAIQWEQGNWGRTNLEYAVYVWDEYKYVSWNGSIGAMKDGIIPAMQGFFVKSNASGGTLTIPVGSRLHSTQLFYKATETVSDMISMRIENTSDTAHFDEAFVHIISGSTAGFDSNHDAWKLQGNGSYPEIYTKATDQSILSINTQPEMVSIPVEFKAGVAGSYKITFGNFESFNPSQPLFFEDKTAQTAINIRNTGEYVFTSDGTPETGRFVLHFQEVGMDEHTATLFSAWNDGNIIRIAPKAGIRHVDRFEVFNLTGQQEISTTGLDLPASVHHQLPEGLHILRITSANSIYTQKILIR